MKKKLIIDADIGVDDAQAVMSFCDRWLGQGTEKAAFMQKITSLSMKKAKSADYQKEVTEGQGFNSCDTYAMAAAIDDTFIIESEEVAVSVELEGTYTRGMMVLDYMGLLKKKHKAIIMKKVDLEKFKKMLVKSLE
ncbi:Inosine-uridine preferring nucleoside hydrolase [Liparis tanakae]|uniref:Inosine-uridine preferring nucleoside hydrolase n=1 Tax=Liparis tanakae TaxID=230148 RepID=A0A4Z2GGC7_9TELE|nr:Inosine-uridine preferring nucleoside hydrolase [Liparis tanakae]